MHDKTASPFSRLPVWLSLWWFLPASLAAHAQMTPDMNRDSLRVVTIAKPDDTLKVAALILLGNQYEYNQPDSAAWYYQQAGDLSRQLHYHTGFIRYVTNYSSVLNTKGKFDESLKLNLEAVDTCLKYGLSGMNYIRAFGNTATAYQYKGDYANAVQYYLKTLPVAESMGDMNILSTLNNNLSALYRDLGQNDKAILHSQRSLNYAEKENDRAAEADASVNLGILLTDSRKYDNALRYIQKGLAIARQLHDSVLTEACLVNLGDTYEKMQDYAKSIPAYRQALELAQALKDVRGQANAWQGLAIAAFRSRQYDSAEMLLRNALPFDSLHDQQKIFRDALLLMSDVQIALGRPDSSRSYRERYDSVSATYLNADLRKNIQELETKYEVEKKDRLATRQRGWLIAAAIAVVLLTVLFILFGLFARQKQENERLKARLEGQQQERQRISQEMHDDMGSGLTSLLFLSRSLQTTTAGAAATEEMREQHEGLIKRMQNTAEGLIRKMNEIIWTMNNEQDTIESLFAYIRTNTAETLENAGIDYDFAVIADAEIALSQEFRRNIYLVTKEAVHNVIRHARASKVTISLVATEAQLNIIIRDNGKGIDTMSGNRFGNGLKNMQRRMEQVRGTFTIRNDNGTLVDLQAPLAFHAAP